MSGGRGLDSVKEPRAGERQQIADNWDRKINKLRGAPPIQIGAEGDHVGDPNRSARLENEFPARLIPKDKRDEYILDKEDAYKFENRKATAAGDQTVVTRSVGQEDVEYLRRKRANVNRLQYEHWLTQAIDLSDPTQGKKKKAKRPPNKKTALAKTRAKRAKTNKKK